MKPVEFAKCCGMCVNNHKVAKSVGWCAIQQEIVHNYNTCERFMENSRVQTAVNTVIKTTLRDIKEGSHSEQKDIDLMKGGIMVSSDHVKLYGSHDKAYEELKRLTYEQIRKRGGNPEEIFEKNS